MFLSMTDWEKRALLDVRSGLNDLADMIAETIESLPFSPTRRGVVAELSVVLSEVEKQYAELRKASGPAVPGGGTGLQEP